MGTTDHPVVELYWRPGCVFCSALRRSLHRSGLAVREVNIWDDPEAAARVRSVADGNETVPTVFVGSRGLVNPTIRQVRAAVHDQSPRSPDPAATPAASAAPAAPATARPAGWLGWLAAVGFALLWVLLAARDPTTTYHLAPLLVAAAIPVTHRWSTGSRLGAGPAARLAAAGLGLAIAVTAGLAWQGWLAGPDLVGGQAAVAESVILAGLGAGLGWWLAGPARRARTPSATV